LRRAEFALYRRVIEIHDGRLSLLPYYPARHPVPDTQPPEGTAADGTDRPPSAVQVPVREGAEAAAAVEAAALVAGLAARRAGARPRQVPPARTARGPAHPGGESIEADVAWLLLVAREFAAASRAAAAASAGTGDDPRRPEHSDRPDRKGSAVDDGSAAS
jgi:hypothetical protein